MDRRKEETKLVVLEYLSSLPAEKITGRNRQHSMPLNANLRHTWPHQCRPRRGSDVHDRKVRERLTNMLDPLRKKLSRDLLADITTFDKKRLKSASDNDEGCQLPCLRFGTVENGLTTPETPGTPITRVTLRLEQLSQCIMEEFPGILDQQVCELLTPLESTNKQISYEQFSAVATSVFENNWTKITKSIWAKVALVFYLVKEVVFSDVLSEIQVDTLVDYASRYVAENSIDCINKAGGWTALECHGDPLLGPDELTGELYDPLENIAYTDPDKTQVRSKCGHAEAVNDAPCFQGTTNMLVKLSSYSCTAAVLAVGIGFAYMYLKYQ